MIGVDTNVLVRLLVADDPAQHALSRAFFERRNAGDPAYISAIVLAETVWLLRKRLRYSREAVDDAIRGLLESDDFAIESGQQLRALLERPVSERAQLADHLVAWAAEASGCSSTVTFDRTAAARIPSMTLLA